MKNKTLKALRAFQENVSVSDYEFDKGEDYISSQDWDDENILGGLNKREYFAGLALQGFLANPKCIDKPDKYICSSVILLADELLKQLEPNSNNH